MLPALRRELERGVRRRRVRSHAASACAVVLLLGGAIVAAMLTTAPRGAPTPTLIAEAPIETADQTNVRIEVVRSMSAPSIQIVRDSPRDSLVDIYTTPNVDIASIRVTDHELLDILNEMGRPTGLVRANGRVWLTAAVTDDEIAKRRGW